MSPKLPAPSSRIQLRNGPLTSPNLRTHLGGRLREVGGNVYLHGDKAVVDAHLLGQEVRADGCLQRRGEGARKPAMEWGAAALGIIAAHIQRSEGCVTEGAEKVFSPRRRS